jgi:hypothetical protein
MDFLSTSAVRYDNLIESNCYTIRLICRYISALGCILKNFVVMNVCYEQRITAYFQKFHLQIMHEAVPSIPFECF